MRYLPAKNAIVIGLLFTFALLVGCVAPPATDISGEFDGHPFRIKSPKQVDMTGFKLNADKTKGTFDLTIDRLGSTNSSDVIQTTGAAQIGLVNAVGNAAGQVAQQIVQGMATGGASVALKEAIRAAPQPAAPALLRPGASTTSTNSP